MTFSPSQQTWSRAFVHLQARRPNRAKRLFAPRLAALLLVEKALVFFDLGQTGGANVRKAEQGSA